ncbi:MAG: GTPase, partial [Candidatus Nanohaloarchaea archaeon]
MGIDDRIEELKEKLQETPVNKSTETERGRLKARIAELKEEKQQKQKGTGETSGYAVKKRGDATVALVGFPSVGKSTLLNRLTNAESETGKYEFTTLDVEPGMLEYRGAKIQLLDVPGLIGG